MCFFVCNVYFQTCIFLSMIIQKSRSKWSQEYFEIFFLCLMIQWTFDSTNFLNSKLHQLSSEILTFCCIGSEWIRMLPKNIIYFFLARNLKVIGLQTYSYKALRPKSPQSPSLKAAQMRTTDTAAQVSMPIMKLHGAESIWYKHFRK